jgi:hypothetical protein
MVQYIYMKSEQIISEVPRLRALLILDNSYQCNYKSKTILNIERV